MNLNLNSTFAKSMNLNLNYSEFSICKVNEFEFECLN